MKRTSTEFRAITAFYVLALLAGFWVLRSPCWLALSAALSIHVLLYTRGNLHLNRPLSSGEPFQGLGPANAATLLRGGLVAATAGFICFTHPMGLFRWAPAILYSVAAALDWADGWLARSTGRVSALGKALDMHLDAIGVLVASAVAIRYGRLPVWYISVGLARYAYLAGLWMLKRAGREPGPMPPSATRRFMAGTMMAFLAASLYPVFPQRPLLVVGTAIFVPFAWGFVRDFLYVGGWLGRGTLLSAQEGR